MANFSQGLQLSRTDPVSACAVRFDNGAILQSKYDGYCNNVVIVHPFWVINTS